MQRYLKGAAAAAAIAFSPMAATSANAAVFIFDVSGIFSVDALGDPLNEVYDISIGTNSEVVGIGWDVSLFADSPSWLSEMVVNFGSSSAAFVNLTVGIGDNEPGTQSYSSGGIVDLVGIGLNFSVNADGILRMEFFESFDDFPDDWDGRWLSGALSIQTADTGAVPEPATWAMMIAGFGLVGLAARRRRMALAR
jgi:hypothetical protein